MENPVYVLTKPKSRQTIEVFIDKSMDPDGWFYEIKYIEKKTNKTAHAHCVIKKDLESWLRSLQSEGWIMETK
jgi:hypothetical protein